MQRKIQTVFPEKPIPRRIDPLIKLIPVVVEDLDTDEVYPNSDQDPTEED